MFDEYFKTTDYKNLKITPEQSLLINKDIQLVQGSDFHKNYYDIQDKSVIKNIYVRYYQIALFDEFEKYALRSFLFLGSSSSGECFFTYKIIELKDYKLSKNKINRFINHIDKNNSKYKIMYKFHPVYNFDYTNPPTGNDINQCQSELLKF